MSHSANFEWPQGEDLILELRYREGNTPTTAKPVNLAAGYTARMTIVSPTAPHPTLLELASGTEISLTSGSNSPNITVRLSRNLTLGDGPFASSGNFPYDLFLRNTSSNVQVKILEGKLNVRRSYTQWE